MDEFQTESLRVVCTCTVLAYLLVHSCDLLQVFLDELKFAVARRCPYHGAVDILSFQFGCHTLKICMSEDI